MNYEDELDRSRARKSRRRESDVRKTPHSQDGRSVFYEC